MDPDQGSPTEGKSSSRNRLLAGRTIVLAAGLAAVLVSGTAVAAVRLRDTSGNGGGQAAPAATSSTLQATTTTAPPPTTTTRPRPKPRPTPKLRPGDRSQSVMAVQRHLIELGYIDLAKATGHFDPATAQAVLAFQKVNGLGRDSVVGPATWKALRADRPLPAPHKAGKGFHVETDLTRQVTYLVTDGRISGVINASTASGRTYEVKGHVRLAVTPRGSFKIQRRINAWRKSDLGLLYRPAYFSGGYAYHGSFSVPGWPASHGCIRMSIATMDRVYDKLAVGTDVYIYRS